MKTPLDLMFPEAEKEPKDLPEAVQDLRRDYQMVQEAVKLQQGRNYSRLQKLYTGDEDGRFKIGNLILFFDDRAVPGVTGKLQPRWTGPHQVIRVENRQQYHVEEEKTGRIFMAHRSQMRRTSREQMAEDGRRTVLLRPGQPLEDAEDTTICTETTVNGSRLEQHVRDEIL